MYAWSSDPLYGLELELLSLIYSIYYMFSCGFEFRPPSLLYLPVHLLFPTLIMTLSSLDCYHSCLFFVFYYL
jgi:hypothetical protein